MLRLVIGRLAQLFVHLALCVAPAAAQFKGCVPGLCNGSQLGGGRAIIVNDVAEGDSITLGLGGQPAYPFAAVSQMPGGIAGNPNTNTPTQSPVTGVGTVNINDIATSGISTLTLVQNYATRAGASYLAPQLNVLTYMAGTNTSGGSDNSAGLKYFLIREYLRSARNTGYQRVVVGTTIARDDDGGTTWANILVPLNASIRAYYNSDMQADGLADFGASPLFSPASAALNLTYYTSDMLHPNVAGEAAMGTILEPVLFSAFQSPGALVLAPSTWSPFSDTAATGGEDGTATLSGDLRTITIPTGFANYGQRGFPGVHSGKYCFEFDVTVNNTVTVGTVNDNFVWNNAAFIGNDVGNNSIGYANSGAIRVGGVTLATAATFQTADNIQECGDFNTKLVWFRRSRSGISQPWNGNASADPATEVGGVSISALQINGAGDRFYPAGGIRINTDAVLSRFAASQLTQTVPTGFTAGFGP